MDLNDLKIGDTVTDGNYSYVLDRDYDLHPISSGNHAKYHVSKEKLEAMLK